MSFIPDYIQELLDTFSFRNSDDLRPAGASLEYSQEMLDEYKKCKNDPVYFIRNYVTVVHPDRGAVLMDLYPFQEDMIRMYHENKRVVFMTPRQYGKTTVSAAYFVWYAIFNDTKSVAILANKQATADEIMQRVRFAYSNLPKWLQQGVVTWNKRSIELENGSKIFGAATSSSGIRGKSIQLLYIDEWGFVPNNIAEEFFTSVYPTITAGENTKVFITSTPNGLNHFWKTWNEAVNGVNGFAYKQVLWTEMPGRTQEWYNKQVEVLGALKASQELSCQFLGSSMTLLSGATLSRLTHSIPIAEPKEQYLGLKVYANVESGRVYTISVDTSRGRHLDDSAFIVFDITDYPHTIAATYKNNEVPPLMYAQIVESIAKMYNNAYLLIEINDIGAQVADTIYRDLEYEGEMFWTKSGDILGAKGADPYPGIRTTKKTKRIGCANAKDMIDNNQVIINDFELIFQLSTFIQSKTGSYEADEGFHDDLVMCIVLHAWLCAQSWFGDLTNTNLRKTLHDQHIAEMEEMMLMPTFNDGSPIESGQAYYDTNFDSSGDRSSMFW
jgi:hypothetical protein